MNFCRSLLFLSASMWGSVFAAGDDPIEAMMKLWQYDDPKTSALVFSSLIYSAMSSEDKDYLPAVLSQIARSYAIRGDFNAAHKQLDEVKSLIEAQKSRANVFYLLERGRIFNSEGDKKRARLAFDEAFTIAQEIGDDYLAIDAAHMMGIVESLGGQQRWHDVALKIAEQSNSAFARNWLGTLYNNMGWTQFDQGKFSRALELFTKNAEFRREKEQHRREQIARWAIGRTLRALDRLPEALPIQEKLMDERTSAGYLTDGRVLEEIGEIYRLMGRTEAHVYFSRAYHLLAADPYIVRDEPDRLARLKELSAIQD